MAVKVRLRTPACPAWQFPAPELANLSAMPAWLSEVAHTGDQGLYVNTGGGVSVAKPGDWLVQLPSGVVTHVRAGEFEEGWEIA